MGEMLFGREIARATVLEDVLKERELHDAEGLTPEALHFSSPQAPYLSQLSYARLIEEAALFFAMAEGRFKKENYEKYC